MAPIFEGLAKKETRVKFVKIDIDDHQGLAGSMEVQVRCNAGRFLCPSADVVGLMRTQAVPTFRFYSKGNRIPGEIVGADSTALTTAVGRMVAGGAA